MMAAEAAHEKPTDAPSTTDSKPVSLPLVGPHASGSGACPSRDSLGASLLTRSFAIQVLNNEAATQNVDQNSLAALNGGRTPDEIENKRITSVEEQTVSTDVSVSGGSDTEASKADSSRPQSDKGHARTSSSVKKPATFKAVSVNKTFLGSKGGSSATTSTSGDKSPAAPGTPNTQLPQSAVVPNRPRLIAKTGSGSRDSTTGSAANGGKPATAPNPTTVWNKNRRRSRSRS